MAQAPQRRSHRRFAQGLPYLSAQKIAFFQNGLKDKERKGPGFPRVPGHLNCDETTRIWAGAFASVLNCFVSDIIARSIS